MISIKEMRVYKPQTKQCAYQGANTLSSRLLLITCYSCDFFNCRIVITISTAKTFCSTSTYTQKEFTRIIRELSFCLNSNFFTKTSVKAAPNN